MNFTAPKIVSVFGLLKNRFSLSFLKQIPIKKIGKIFQIIALTALIATAGFEIVSHWNFFENFLRPAAGNTKTGDGNYFTAVTDINLRENSSGKASKVGLVPKGSVVKIVSESKNGNWCRIIIQQYSRTKEDPASSDQGWINKSNLVPQ